ncbi:8631_t:CDS:1, partial [Scutellospora calospora]
TDRSTFSCKIVNIIGEKYKLGYKFDIINVCYSSGELESLRTTTYPKLNEIPLYKLSLREAARLQSVSSLSSTICNCKGSYNNCKYRCKKAGSSCTSRCHGGKSFFNKK